MKLGVVAGEPSGDLLGAGLIETLSPLQATGLGGSHMIKAGFQSLFEMERLSVMGLIEPLLHLPDLFKLRKDLFHHFQKNRPDVFVGIDSPDFNLGLELKLRNLNIPTVHYVSPSVWAWRKKRVFKIAKAVDLVLTLFPFEADFYKQHHVPVSFVGHPLADQIPLEIDQLAARKKLNLSTGKIYIAILPGSRRNEIKQLGEVFIRTAQHCLKARPEIEFISSSVNDIRHYEFQQFATSIGVNLPLHIFKQQSHDVMAAADVVLVASGTATLETMLFKKPMVIAYRLAPLTYQIGKRLVSLSFIGLPNLLANEKLVPEFIQHDATPEKLSKALLDYLDHPEKIDALKNRFIELHHQLRCNASQKAAEAIVQLIGG